MTQPDDGGQAFPTQETDSRYGSPGMTLREHFAGQALMGLLSERRSGEPRLYYNAPADEGGSAPDNRAFIPQDQADAWAKNAYKLADAMIAERDK